MVHQGQLCGLAAGFRQGQVVHLEVAWGSGGCRGALANSRIGGQLQPLRRVHSLRGGDWIQDWVPPAILRLPFGTRSILVFNLVLYIGGFCVVWFHPILELQDNTRFPCTPPRGGENSRHVRHFCNMT